MKVALLDVNLLIALVWPTHRHHAPAHRWFESRDKTGWAHLPADDTTPADVKTHINELYAKAGIKDRKP